MENHDELINQLLEENKLLKARIAELEKRLGLNSNNSSKPPSSDGFNKPPRINTKSLREVGKKSSGGQKGHPGETLNQVACPDRIIHHQVLSCPHCATDLREEPQLGLMKRQVHDIPAPRLEVTEHQAEVKYCLCCARTVHAFFPAGVDAPVQYGERIQSYSVYFHHQQLIPEDRVQQLFSDLFRLSITTATIVRFGKKLYQGLEGFTCELFAAVQKSARKHLDETGFRIGGKTQWLHVASNDTLTYYHVSPKRKSLLSGLEGIVCHDHWKSYYQLKGVKHALCNAHHVRELNALIEYEKEKWARKMKRFLYFALKCKQHHEDVVPFEKQRRLEILYDKIIEEGFAYHARLPMFSVKPSRGRLKQRTGYNLLLRLSNYKQDALCFLTVPTVPFSNNQAEQDVRMMKVKQKISGSFRTTEGAEIFVRIRSFISTMRKQGQNIFTALTKAVSGNVPHLA